MSKTPLLVVMMIRSRMEGRSRHPLNQADDGGGFKDDDATATKKVIEYR